MCDVDMSLKELADTTPDLLHKLEMHHTEQSTNYSQSQLLVPSRTRRKYVCVFHARVFVVCRG